MVHHQDQSKNKGKVQIKKMWRLQNLDTHFFDTTLAKRTRIWD